MTATQVPETKEEFHDRMRTLVQSAESNGIDLRGGYVVQSETGQHDWELVLTQIVKPEMSAGE